MQFTLFKISHTHNKHIHIYFWLCFILWVMITSHHGRPRHPMMSVITRKSISSCPSFFRLRGHSAQWSLRAIPQALPQSPDSDGRESPFLWPRSPQNWTPNQAATSLALHYFSEDLSGGRECPKQCSIIQN